MVLKGLIPELPLKTESLILSLKNLPAPRLYVNYAQAWAAQSHIVIRHTHKRLFPNAGRVGAMTKRPVF